MQVSTGFNGSETGNRLTMPLLGALGLGASFAFFGAIWGMMVAQVLPTGYVHPWMVSGLYASAGGLGSITFAVLGKAKPARLFLAGAIGCGLGYYLTFTSRTVLHNFLMDLIPPSIPLETSMQITTIAQFALMGALFGALLGIALRSPEKVILLAFVGAAGFGTGQLLAPSPKTLYQIISSFHLRMSNSLLYAIIQAVYSGLMGLLSGMMFGWILGEATGVPLSRMR